MRGIRRAGGVAFAGLLLTAVVGGPSASAQTETKTPETYVGTAAGRVLNLSVANNALTAGASNVSLDSTLKAVAQGTGLLSPLGGVSQTPKLEQIGEGVKNSAEACGTDPVTGALPAELASVLSLNVACSSAIAEVKNGLPHALATGKVAGADVDLSVITNTAAAAGVPVGTLATILDPVLGGVGTLETALEDNLGQQINLTDTLDQVVTALVETKTLEVTLGTSSSESIVDGSKVTSIAKSEGGTIKLFPVGAVLETAAGVELKPIVEIVIGSASASSTYDRATGKSTPAFDPAILTIRLNTPLVSGLNDLASQLPAGIVSGYDFSEIVINPNLTPSQLAGTPAGAAVGAVVKACSDAPNEFCILEGTPVETRIAVASGRTVTNADGSVGAVADAVKVHALRNIAQVPGVGSALAGGILLELAHAEAGVGGRPAELVTIAAPEIPRELPRTGGTPVLPLVGVAGVGIALAARRTLAKATSR